MVTIRSLIYFIFMTLSTLLFGIPMLLVSLFMPFDWVAKGTQWWARLNMWSLKMICGLDIRVQGREKIPEGGALYMSKHQSAWETIAFGALLDPPISWVLKQELLKVPVFGWILARMHPIAIDRSAGRKAVQQVKEQGRARLADGRNVVIFPEGTRTSPGQYRKYNIGGGVLAVDCEKPVIPVAHNAGVFWSRRSLQKYPGTIDMVIGDPLPVAGKKAGEIMAMVEEWIETESRKLPGNALVE